jgi:hypothetical protein
VLCYLWWATRTDKCDLWFRYCNLHLLFSHALQTSCFIFSPTLLIFGLVTKNLNYLKFIINIFRMFVRYYSKLWHFWINRIQCFLEKYFTLQKRTIKHIPLHLFNYIIAQSFHRFLTWLMSIVESVGQIRWISHLNWIFFERKN